MLVCCKYGSRTLIITSTVLSVFRLSDVDKMIVHEYDSWHQVTANSHWNFS